VPTVHARALRRAAALCGEEALARKLEVSGARIRVWASGAGEPPDAIFLQVVDILGELALRQLLRLSLPDSFEAFAQLSVFRLSNEP